MRDNQGRTGELIEQQDEGGEGVTWTPRGYSFSSTGDGGKGPQEYKRDFRFPGLHLYPGTHRCGGSHGDACPGLCACVVPVGR
ncbi:hypothetical protein EYF80_062991 [Liparis tanakae]|uniref:Uncharacterized protein n=1 Tax=Liparis tanakae TaxID=230148 RepID=A0A4Z2ED81_9TELE|nr:hypothetical protein EYF80_062991 [Liparis tanakae]